MKFKRSLEGTFSTLNFLNEVLIHALLYIKCMLNIWIKNLIKKILILLYFYTQPKCFNENNVLFDN